MREESCWERVHLVTVAIGTIYQLLKVSVPKEDSNSKQNETKTHWGLCMEGVSSRHILGFLFTFFLIRGLITLQCCVSFCHITAWISYIYIYIYIYIPSFLSLPSHPLGHHRALSWAPWDSRFPLARYFMHGSVHASILFSQFVLPLHMSPCLFPTSSLLISSSLSPGDVALLTPACRQMAYGEIQEECYTPMMIPVYLPPGVVEARTNHQEP